MPLPLSRKAWLGIFAVSILCAVPACAPVRSSRASAPSGEQTSLAGTWQLVSIATRWPDGRTTQPWGANPVGQLIYGADGRMAAVLMDARRNQADGRSSPTDVQSNVASYYGTYVVDANRHVVTHRVEASIRTSEAGAIERTYQQRGDSLVLTAAAVYEGSPVVHTLVWRRAPGRG